MRQSDIKVGKTYQNRGKGRTKRKVISISLEDNPYRKFGFKDDPERFKKGVVYSTNDNGIRVSLAEFARWAGSEVEEVSNETV